MWFNWKRWSLGALLLASLSLLFAGCGDYSGSSTSQKTITGVVSDPATGLPLGNAKVTAYAIDASGAQGATALSSPATVQADNRGHYSLRIPAGYSGSVMVQATSTGSALAKLAKLVFDTPAGEVSIRAAVPKSLVAKGTIPPVMVSLATDMVVQYLATNNGGSQAFTPDNIRKATVVMETFFGPNFSQTPPPSSSGDNNTSKAQQDLIVSIQAMGQVAPTAEKMVQVVAALAQPAGLGSIANDVKGGIAQAAATLAQQGVIPAEYIPSAAINSAISNAQFAPVTANIADTTPPAAPTGLSVAGTTGKSATLAWNASTDADLAGYLVYRAGDSGEFVTVGSVPRGTNSFSDFTVLPSARYSYQVVAFDAGRNLSDPSNAASATTPALSDTTPPSPPTGAVCFALAQNQVGLRWNLATKVTADGRVVPAARYNVFRDSQFIGSTTDTSFMDKGASPSSNYVYYVKASDANSNLSPASQAVYVHTPAAPAQAPADPGNASVQTGSNSVTVTWDASATAGARYSVYRDGRMLAAGLSATGYVDALVTPNSDYTYTVSAVTFAADGTPQESAGVRVAAHTQADTQAQDTTPPSVPANLSVTNFSSNSVALMWSASSKSGSNGIVAGYDVLRADNGSTGFVKIATVTKPGYVDGSVSGQSSYSYAVKSFSSAGYRSEASNAATVATAARPDLGDTTAPQPPASLALASPATSSSVSLTWPAAIKENQDATHFVAGYLVYRDGLQLADVKNMLSFTDTTVAPATSYRYAVKAYDTSGNFSSFSQELLAATPVAAANSCSISGRVTLNGVGLYGVVVSNSGNSTQAVTDVNGNYSMSGLPAGSYAITPSFTAYYQFTPSSRRVTVSGGNATGIDFGAVITGFVSTGVSYPDGTIVGGISFPSGTVIGGVYYPYSTVIGGVNYPTSSVIGGVSFPSGTVIGGVSYPAGTIVGGIAFPAGAVTTGIATPTGTVIGGVVYPTGSVVSNVGYPTGVVYGGVTYPSGTVRGGVIYPTAGVLAGASYPTGSVSGGVLYPAGALLAGVAFPSGGVSGGTSYPTGATVNGVYYPSGGVVGGVSYPGGTVIGSIDYSSPFLLSGSVTRSGGGAVAGAVVVLNGGSYSTTTNSLGYYYFRVASGSYQVSLQDYANPAITATVSDQSLGGFDFTVGP